MKIDNFKKIRTPSACIVLVVSLAGEIGQGQTAGQAGASPLDDYAVVKAGPHTRLWQNSAGQSVTEIATGLNYWDGTQWTLSNPQFVLSPDGKSFVADQIQDPTTLAANLNVVGAVTVTTPDGVKLSSTPIAIGLYDAASGLSVIVASLTNTTGVLTDPKDVVYDRAFAGGGFSASVVYSVPDPGSFHQDVVFDGFDPNFNPTNWGFVASATNTLQIQIITEFYDPPQPLMQTNVAWSETDPAKRAGMASPDLYDYTLDFGHYVFGKGRAYTTAKNVPGAGGVRVAKDFVTSNGRTFLIESIPYLWLVGQLQGLPPVVQRSSSLKPKAHKTRMAAAAVPSLRKGRNASLNPPAKASALAVKKPRGVDIDYVVTVSSTVEPTLFASDTTYFVTNTVTCSSSTTFESAVFKYPTNGGSIVIEGALTMSTTNYRPAIFTAADDNTAGAPLSASNWAGYTGSTSGRYYGNPAIVLNNNVNVSMNDFRMCYMTVGLELTANDYGQSFTFTDTEILNSQTNFEFNGEDGGTNSFSLNNCLIANASCICSYDTALGILLPMYLTGNAYNCTFDTCSDLFEANTNNINGTLGGTFTYSNCIFSHITTKGSFGTLTMGGKFNGFYIAPNIGTSTFTNSSSPYLQMGAGNYYLSSTGSFLTEGVSNIPSPVLARLKSKTVLAPTLLTNLFTVNTTLAPAVQRDLTGTALGFHYDPIDYITACAVSNASLVLTNGVALAYYDNFGIWLQDGSQLISQGQPNYRNYLAYYGLVQEQPTNLWNTNTAVAQSLPIASEPYGSSSKPSIYLRLTTICAPQGETNLLNTADFGITGQIVAGLTLRDCEVYGSGANWVMNGSNAIPPIGLTNNVFYRVPFAITNNAVISCYNNLFYGSTNSPGNVTNTTVSIHFFRPLLSQNTHENNVFDGVTASLDGTVGYNAYLHGGTNTTIQVTDKTNNLTWVAGPLGAYYQATNSPLLTNGSTYATNLGLYHYTVLTNLTWNGTNGAEATNIVSRGYHYVALGSNGLPLDYNGDGTPDYLEDANGNGVVDWGELDWLVPGDLGLSVVITRPQPNSVIP